MDDWSHRRDTLHIPTLIHWLKDFNSAKNPTNFQLIEAWQIAQTLHGICYPEDQKRLDQARRDIMSYLARSENQWNDSHTIVPSRRRLRSWTEVELTPELSWSTLLAGRTVPNALVKRLRTALGHQHANLKRILIHGVLPED
jgi:hypothetical protein